MPARIYRPAKTAMQSGTAKTHDWVFEFEQAQARTVEPLMGWTSSRDTRQQVRLHFATKEEAVAYAQRSGIAYVLREPHEKPSRRLSYSDNFRYGRRENWTH